MPVRILITAGTVADCTQASTLIDGLDAQYLLADKGYDADAIVAQAEANQMTVASSRRRKIGHRLRVHQDLYRLRHLVENAFLHLKR